MKPLKTLVVICWFTSSVKLKKIQVMDNKPTSELGLPTNDTVLQQVALSTYFHLYSPRSLSRSSPSFDTCSIVARIYTRGVQVAAQTSRSRCKSTIHTVSIQYVYYRAMHFSAKRGLAIVCLSVSLSVRPSVCNVGGL